MNCRSCNNRIEPGDRFCRECGTMVEFKCPKCSTPVSDSSKFCSECGAKLKENNSGYFIDERDGNRYKWVKIGEQIWMAENLRYMPHVCPANTYNGIWVSGYNGFDVDIAKNSVNYIGYGCLYDWEHAVNSVPKGWKLPDIWDWEELMNFLGGEDIAGRFLKGAWTPEARLLDSSKCSIDKYGFNALPAGDQFDGTMGWDYYDFRFVGECTFFWSNTDSNDTNAWGVAIEEDEKGQSIMYRHIPAKKWGISVRCIKDE